jgi:hypothetical protein
VVPLLVPAADEGHELAWSHESVVGVVPDRSLDVVVVGAVGPRPVPVPVPPWSHEPVMPDWSHELVPVLVPPWSFEFVPEPAPPEPPVPVPPVPVPPEPVPLMLPEPMPPPAHGSVVTSGWTRKSWIPACFSAALSPSLACV